MAIGMAVSGAVSALVFASSIETAFSINLPVVDSIVRVNTQPVNKLLDMAKQTDQSNVGNFGKPEMLKIPNLDTKVVLAPEIINKDDKLARANTAHFAIIGQPKNGSLGDTVIYIKGSWRTIERGQDVKSKDNFFIDTDGGWRYQYRIDSTRNFSSSENAIVKNDQRPQLIMLIDYGDRLQVIEATQISVQNNRI